MIYSYLNMKNMTQYSEKLQDFLKTKSEKQKLIVIYGPTWSWKTSLSIDIGQELKTEIISTDSRQIFCKMDIWTWKIMPHEMQWITHHMIDIIMPDMPYSVSEFKSESEKIIEWLHKKNKIPILAWGTGLYIDSLIYDFQVWGTPGDEAIRQKLEWESWEELYARLQAVDPDYALELHPNNKQYVVRALEVYEITWKSKRDFRKTRELKYDVLFLCPDYGSREDLYDKINKRVEEMFAQWLEREVSMLISDGYDEHAFWMKSIGYSEFFPYLQGEYDLACCKDLIQQHSRNYAKRQLTWFRKYEK